MIDIVVVSDIKIYREGLGQILSDSTISNIKASEASLESALDVTRKFSPQVVLLDMTMHGSCELACRILQISPATKIVALAVSYDESNIMECAEAGITCYVPREASVTELIDAIVEAAKGKCYCPPKIAECLLKKVQHLALSAKSKYLVTESGDAQLPFTPEQGREIRLTRRETQISQLLAEGMSNKQIARTLSIEVSTVKNHVHNVLVKLEVSSRGQAVCYLQEQVSNSRSESIYLAPFIEITP